MMLQPRHLFHLARRLPISGFPRSAEQHLELLHTVDGVGFHLVFAFAGIQFQTHPFGRMRVSIATVKRVPPSATASTSQVFRFPMHPILPSASHRQRLSSASRSQLSGTRSSRYLTAATNSLRSSARSTVARKTQIAPTTGEL